MIGAFFLCKQPRNRCAEFTAVKSMEKCVCVWEEGVVRRKPKNTKKIQTRPFNNTTKCETLISLVLNCIFSYNLADLFLQLHFQKYYKV